MMWNLIKKYLPLLFITLGFAFLLGGERWSYTQGEGHFIRRSFQELQAILCDPEAQPWALASLVSYLVAFSVIAWRGSHTSRYRVLAAVLAPFLSALSYFTVSGQIGCSTQDILVLAGGCVLGLGLAFWIRIGSRPPVQWLWQVALSLVFLLAAGALMTGREERAYEYRTVARATGLWNNPNTFGLLMGCGLVLAVGLLAQALVNRPPAGSCKTGLWKSWLWLLLLPAAFILATGLLQSLSRGAWLGTALAMGWLGYYFLRHHHGEPKPIRSSPLHHWLPWITLNQRMILLLLFASGTLSFWTMRHIEHPYIRRVFTMGNPTDFSWRNRILSYEQALHMMSDRPLLGYGWSEWQEVHREFYQPLTQEEGSAITLNDYFVLGITSGIPALLAFLAYIWLTLCPKRVEVGIAPDPDHFLHRVAHAGATVLLVGFWFDGGLFKLALATPFWVLMELVCNRHHRLDTQIQQAPPSNLSASRRLPSA